MKIYCGILTATKVFNLLKELKITELLNSESESAVSNVLEIMEKLLIGGKLNEFLQIITKTNIDFAEDEETYSAERIGEMITNFLLSFKKMFPGYSNMININQP